MTKTEFVSNVAEAVKLTKKDVAAVIDAALKEVGDALAKGDKCTFVGFGSFEVRERAAREGRNPQDPTKKIQIPARKVPVFKAGKGLRDIVNK